MPQPPEEYLLRYLVDIQINTITFPHISESIGESKSSDLFSYPIN